MSSNKTPRGIRNNNPGNLRWGDPWQGMVPASERTDKDFVQFQSPKWGIRAMLRTLITYYDKYGINTVQAAIRRWAPPNENDTQAYINAVAARIGVTPTQHINFHDYHVLSALFDAITIHENRKGPLKNSNTWYTQEQIDEGMKLAGVVPPGSDKIKVTKETLGASATAAVGAGQLVEVMPEVVNAMDKAEGHISSGSIIRVLFGVATIALAAYIAYQQVNRQKKVA